MNNRKIGFVIPWYGNLNGGAEVFCAGLAASVSALGFDVEVLTTCCRDPFHDWGTNQLPSGLSEVNGVTVRRFPVRPRDAQLYVQLFRAMENGEKLSPEQQEQLLENSINSTELVNYITGSASQYHFFFVPYLYGTTCFGLRAATAATDGLAYLIPCLHDEAFAHLDIIRRLFESAHASLFLSEPELELARRLYDAPDEKHFLLGAGVNKDAQSGSAQRFRESSGIKDRFILAVGRKVPGKGSDILLRYFAQYITRHPNETLQLVMIGSGDIDIPFAIKNRVVSVEATNHQEIFDAMAACEFLIQPSFYESFSLVIMEAWLNRKAVVVNGHCEVTRYHAIQANGGLWFHTFPEFAEVLQLLRRDPALASRLGQAGEKYVLQNYMWYDVSKRFVNFVQTQQSTT